MSDLDRNYASPFGRAAGRVDAATVDAGLRAYMLRIYNYMSIGLAITGLAALGIYMAAVTSDPSGAAAKIGSSFLTPFGYAMFVSPLKWLLILAMIVNIFLKSTGLEFAISAIGVLIFAGLTAWDTQRIKEMYSANDDGTVAGRKAVMGALALYLDFINLFLFLLRFMGDRR